MLILSRPNGIILRSAGPLFAHTPTRPTAVEKSAGRLEDAEAEQQTEGADGAPEEAKQPPPPAHSELARKYARAAARMVESVRAEVRAVEGEQEVRGCSSMSAASDALTTVPLRQEDVRFLRIRTKRHELMITPGMPVLLPPTPVSLTHMHTPLQTMNISW